VRPETKHEVAVVTHVAPPELAVIVYFTPDNCDASLGGTKVTNASESPATAVTFEGAPVVGAPAVTVNGIVTVLV
jgi:hypothetical protein